MNAIVSLRDLEERTADQSIVENISDRSHISYQDADGAACSIQVDNDGIIVERISETHRLCMFLKDAPRVEVTSEYGLLELSAKVIEFVMNNDIVFIAYSVEDQRKELEIKYIGV